MGKQVKDFLENTVRRRRKINLAVGLVVVVGLAAVSAVTGLAGALLSNDSFDGPKVDIVDHTPNSDATNSGWSVELGDWEVKGGNVKEKSDAEAEVSSDYRALLDAGVPDVSTVVTLKIDGDDGEQFWGTVVRYTDERDWIMVFHDGEDNIVLGKKRPDEDLIGDTVALIDPSAGGFQELGRFEAEWEEDETHTLGLEVIGSAITAYADGLPIISATDDDSMTSTFVGIFSRGDGGNKVQDFVVNSAP
jgi:hypothetical protein